MNTSSIDFEFYKRVLDELCFESLDFERFMEDGLKDSYFEFTHKLFKEHRDNVTIDIDGQTYDCIFRDGASKVCILIEDDYDYVIKIGFRDKAVDGMCKLEESLYRAACREGVSQFFAACYPLCTYRAVECFLMEYVDCDSNEIDSDVYRHISDEFANSGREYSNDDIYDECNDIEDECAYVSYLFPFYYSHEEVSRLENFLWRYDINDLHNENMGYSGDRIVLIDYSGYHCWNVATTAHVIND